MKRLLSFEYPVLLSIRRYNQIILLMDPGPEEVING